MEHRMVVFRRFSDYIYQFYILGIKLNSQARSFIGVQFSILEAQIVGRDTVCLGDIHGYKSLLAKIDTLFWTTLPGNVAKVVEKRVSILANKDLYP